MIAPTLLVPAACLEHVRGSLLDRGRAVAQLVVAQRLCHLRGALRARPVREHAEAVQPGHAAQLPGAGVRLLQTPLDLVEQARDEVERRPRRQLPREARVEEETADGQDHLAVDVVLDVLERLVADPDRLLAAKPGQPRELLLRGAVAAGDRVRRLELALPLLAQVAQEDEEPLHLVVVAEPFRAR